MKDLKSYEFSLLRNVTSSDVILEPFPHIVIRNALPESFAKLLKSSFPLNKFQLDTNNVRQDFSVCDLDGDNQIINEWKDFIYFHSSEYFLNQIIDIFNGHFPESKHLLDFINCKNLKTGRRGIDSYDSSNILMDAQISINSAVRKSNSVRKIHLDNANKLFSGLFYLRSPDDDSVGGNLRLYSWKKSYGSKEKVKFYQEGVAEKHVNLHQEIRYDFNVLVLFPNSIDALHGVTPREKTNHVRTFVNLVSLLPFDFYAKPEENFFRKKITTTRALISKIKREVLGLRN
jgi:hypothetical protein